VAKLKHKMKSLIKNRKANILTENIIFIILNLLFLSILVVFLFSKMGAVAVLEEKYAKEIALAVDSARPGMIIFINMEDAIKAAGKEGISPEKIVNIDGNVVTVGLSDKKGYSYSFFNNFDVKANYDGEGGKGYFFPISSK